METKNATAIRATERPLSKENIKTLPLPEKIQVDETAPRKQSAGRQTKVIVHIHFSMGACPEKGSRGRTWWKTTKRPPFWVEKVGRNSRTCTTRAEGRSNPNGEAAQVLETKEIRVDDPP